MKNLGSASSYKKWKSSTNWRTIKVKPKNEENLSSINFFLVFSIASIFDLSILVNCKVIDPCPKHYVEIDPTDRAYIYIASQRYHQNVIKIKLFNYFKPKLVESTYGSYINIWPESIQNFGRSIQIFEFNIKSSL